MIIDSLDPKEKLERIMRADTFKCRYCGLAYNKFAEAYTCCRGKHYNGHVKEK